MFDHETTIHHDIQSCGVGDIRTLGTDDSALNPERARPNGHCFTRDPWDRLGHAKDVDNIDRNRNIGERRISRLSEYRRFAWIDRDDREAMTGQILGHSKAGSIHTG